MRCLKVLFILCVLGSSSLGQQTHQGLQIGQRIDTLNIHLPIEDSIKAMQRDIQTLKDQIKEKTLIQQMFTQEIQFYSLVVVLVVSLFVGLGGYLAGFLTTKRLEQFVKNEVKGMTERVEDAKKNLRGLHDADIKALREYETRLKRLEVGLYVFGAQGAATAGNHEGELYFSLKVVGGLVEYADELPDLFREFDSWATLTQGILVRTGRGNLSKDQKESCELILQEVKKSKKPEAQAWAVKMLDLLYEKYYQKG